MEKNKPASMSLKNWIIRNMAVKTGMSERVIETVVNFQFNSAYEKMEECETMEFSGWGRFIFNRKRAKWRMERLNSQIELFSKKAEDQTLSSEERRNASMRVDSFKRNLAVLEKTLEAKKKKNESKGDI